LEFLEVVSDPQVCEHITSRYDDWIFYI